MSEMPEMPELPVVGAAGEAPEVEEAKPAAKVQPGGVWVADPSALPEEGKMAKSATIVVHCRLDLIERLYDVLPSIGSALFVAQAANLIDESWVRGQQGLLLEEQGVVIAANFRRPRQKKYRVEIDGAHVAMLRVALRLS